MEKGHITRTQVFTDSLNPAPLEALAARLQGCLYHADSLQQACEALWVDFPDHERELRISPNGSLARCVNKNT